MDGRDLAASMPRRTRLVFVMDMQCDLGVPIDVAKRSAVSGYEVREARTAARIRSDPGEFQ